MAIESRAVSTVASATLHVMAALIVLLMLQVAPKDGSGDAARMLIPQHLVWVPQQAIGGGRASGGDTSIAPPRRVREVGHDAASAPVVAQPTTAATIEPPDELLAMPLMPMGDAITTLAGTIDGDPALRSAGPGTTGAGDRPGNDRGAGTGSGDAFGPGAIRGGPNVTMPALIERVSPKYTADAMRARIEGSVWIECVVLPDGSVGNARVLRSLDARFGLDQEALAAARRWRFHPGLMNGQPVPVVITIELMFSVR
jgi:TonB family protein